MSKYLFPFLTSTLQAVGGVLLIVFLSIYFATDPELYRRVTGHVDAMRLHAAELPSLSVAWAEVMICHFELMHGVWRSPACGQPGGLVPLRARLDAARERLAHRCLQLMPVA